MSAQDLQEIASRLQSLEQAVTTANARASAAEHQVQVLTQQQQQLEAAATSAQVQQAAAQQQVQQLQRSQQQLLQSQQQQQQQQQPLAGQTAQTTGASSSRSAPQLIDTRLLSKPRIFGGVRLGVDFLALLVHGLHHGTWRAAGRVDDGLYFRRS